MTLSPPVCSHCGHYLGEHPTLVSERVRYHPEQGLWIDDAPAAGSAMVHRLIGALMAAEGRYLSYAALIERIGSGAIDEGAMARLYAHKARDLLRAHGIEGRIGCNGALGYRWVGPVVSRALVVPS